MRLLAVALLWWPLVAGAEIQKHSGQRRGRPPREVRPRRERGRLAGGAGVRQGEGRALRRGGAAQAAGRRAVSSDRHVPRRPGRPRHGAARRLVARRDGRARLGAVPAGRLRRGRRGLPWRRLERDERPLDDRLGHGRRRRARRDRAREAAPVRRLLAHQPLRREPGRQPRRVPDLEGARRSTPPSWARRPRSGFWACSGRRAVVLPTSPR